MNLNGIKIKKLKTVSLFTGGGGLDLGFSAVGFDVRVAVEIDPYACRTLELNAEKKPYFHRHGIICDDIKNVSAKQILKVGKLKPGEVDVVIGGPPCQSFSVFGKRKGLSDPRGDLIWQYLRIITELQPKAFVFENVKGLTTIEGGKIFAELKKALTLDGKYSVSDNLYEVANFGIPQYRQRIIIAGTRKGISLPRMKETHAPIATLEMLKKHVPSKLALRKLPEPGFPEINHVGREHSQRIIDRYHSLAYGERDPKTRINKLNPDKPSFAIIVGSDAGGGKGHVHPFEPREVTPRESARMQTFPDWWIFSGTGRHVIRQVGNAVPVLFAAQLGLHLQRYAFGIHSHLGYNDLIKLLEIDYLIDDNRPIQSQDSLKRKRLARSFSRTSLPVQSV